MRKVYWVGILSGLLALAGCQSGGWAGGGDTGSVYFKAIWLGQNGKIAPQDAQFAPENARLMPENAPAGVNSIVGTVGSSPPVSATFAATPGQPGSGVIDNVPAGGPYTVTATGWSAANGTGTELYIGAPTIVTVSAGATAQTGTIVMTAAHGGLDTSFNSPNGFNLSAGAGFNARAGGMAVDSKGRVIVAGTSLAQTPNPIMTVWRFNPDGTPDNTFNGGGSAVQNYTTHAGLGHPSNGLGVLVDSGDNVIVVGTSLNPASGACGATQGNCMTVWRFLALNGAPDTSFQPGPLPYAVHPGAGLLSQGVRLTLDASGNIVITGFSTLSGVQGMTLWRLIPGTSGGFDPNLYGYSSGSANCPQTYVYDAGAGTAASGANVKISPANTSQLLVVGSTTIAGVTSMAYWNYFYAKAAASTPSCTATSLGSFVKFASTSANYATNNAGVAGQSASAALGVGPAVAGISNVYIAGYNANSANMALWRFKSNDFSGNPDATFGCSSGSGCNGYVTNNAGNSLQASGSAVSIDANENIVVAGSLGAATGITGGTIVAVWRFSPLGALDTTFAAGTGYFTQTATGGTGFYDGLSGGVWNSSGIFLGGRSAAVVSGSTASEVAVVWKVRP